MSTATRSTRWAFTAGSTVTLKLYVSNDLITYYARHSLKADKADAAVFVIPE